MRSTCALLPMTLLSACATAPGDGLTSIGTAVVRLTNGSQIGTVAIADHRDHARLTIEVSRLVPGTHGMHLHTVGRCDPPDFSSAKAHLNPDSRQHGAHNPAGPHLGDLPNLVVGPDGAGRASVVLKPNAAEIAARFFDTDGTALVIHAAADDERTDPTGNSGARVACGVILPGN